MQYKDLQYWVKKKLKNTCELKVDYVDGKPPNNTIQTFKAGTIMTVTGSSLTQYYLRLGETQEVQIVIQMEEMEKIELE